MNRQRHLARRYLRRRRRRPRALDAGFDIRQVQMLMGHESPETTARYDKREATKLFEKVRNMKGLVR